MDPDMKKLRALVDGARRIVFFGGAGVSTESGLPDFRSRDGLYNRAAEIPPETILSHSFFESKPEIFYDYYRTELLRPEARPNAAHYKLAEWERQGRLLAVITQNVDGLHQAAGSKRVLELHGSVYRNSCTRCGRPYPGLERILGTRELPRCGCGGLIRPDVVLYEEPLDRAVLRQAAAAVAQADLLIVGGTSLAVYPAAALAERFRGGKLVILNRDPAPLDARADLVIRRPIAQVLGAL